MNKKQIVGMIDYPIRKEDLRVALFDLVVNQREDPKTFASHKVLEHAIDMLREHCKDFFKQRWELDKDHFETHVGLYSWTEHVEKVDELFEKLFDKKP